MNRLSPEESSVRTITISQRHEGQRIDNFLIRELKGVPRSRVYRIIRKGEVRVNKKRCKPELKLRTGDKVRVPPVRVSSNESKTEHVSSALIELFLRSILYETDEILVINKPSGFAVQGGTGIRVNIIDTLRNIRSEWKGLELAHRLDRDTSGCLVLAKNIIALRDLQSQFKLKTINKIYHAIIVGYWPDELEVVDAPLLKNKLSSGERIVKVAKDGKESKTRFKVIKHFKEATLLEARPETGRTHQIRVHCHYAGFPIVGDTKYSVEFKNSDLKSIKKLCLHAAKIGLKEPGSETLIEIAAPTDKYFESVLENITN